jgi:uncharacterized membrane protein
MLIPEIAAGASHELDELRIACDEAVAAVVAAEPHAVWILGSGPVTAEYPMPLHVSLRRWGRPDLQYRLESLPDQLEARPAGPDDLPLSLVLGVWLAGRVAGGMSSWRVSSVAADTPASACRALGEQRGREHEALGMLVMGDGSACRGERAPGYADPRAEAFDAAVAKALAGVDTDALLGLDPALATDLLVAGRAPWQVLAGAAAAAGRAWRGELLYDQTPYGVGYPVAVWR